MAFTFFWVVGNCPPYQHGKQSLQTIYASTHTFPCNNYCKVLLGRWEGRGGGRAWQNIQRKERGITDESYFCSLLCVLVFLGWNFHGSILLRIGAQF